MKKLWHWLQLLIAVTIFSAALWLVYHYFQAVGFESVWKGIREVSLRQRLLAVALTIFNYLILVGYDWAAVRYLQHPLKLSRIALASFICYALSHNLGWFLGGPPSRYRMYSAAGLSTAEIVKLVTLLWIAYWSGFFALAGLVFVVEPSVVPATLTINDTIYQLPQFSARPLGFVFIAGVLGYLVMTAVWRKPIKWRGREYSLPPLWLASLQVVIAMFDIAVAGFVLYVLLPAEMNVSFAQCLSAYMMAMIIVITVHMPGGIALLEAVVIAILDPHRKFEGLAGALVVYRVIYFLLPLTCALLAYGAHEIWHFWSAPKKVEPEQG